MKRTISNIFLGGMIVFSAALASCDSGVEEQPRSMMTPDLFRTSDGLLAGLNAAYSGLRLISGSQGAMFAMELGTDEFTAATSCTNNALDMTPDNQGTPINSSTGDFSTFWNSSFSYINTCNGIIDYGSEAGLAPGVIAEAKFLRAYYYFILVQMFGGVPLDMGSGELRFNTSPSTVSARNPADQVYAAIISDLQDAVTNLPVAPRTTGAAGKKSAYHYLSKVYLTKGDYQAALSTAEELINNQAAYGAGLLSNYADVIKAGNEHNSEVLFTCERTDDSYTFNGFPGASASDSGGENGKDDRSCSYFTANYPTFFITDGSSTPVGRSIPYSRPWIRMAPTYELITRVFADKTNDSRYYATFQSVWLSNAEGRRGVVGYLGREFAIGDTAFYMPGYEVSDEFRASRNYRIWTPSQFTRDEYPSLQKFFDPNRKALNDASGRPFMLAKLSETYLIAAEAAVKLNNNEKAHNYILTLRKRAATSGNEAAMEIATPATIDIDYILDERSRELCGEQMRWLDLVRTGKWTERAQTYSIGIKTDRKVPGTEIAVVEKRTFTRTIQSHYVLRPVPQGQIDLMNEDVDKDAYQNPGY
jgi:hypothetical protein